MQGIDFLIRLLLNLFRLAVRLRNMRGCRLKRLVVSAWIISRWRTAQIYRLRHDR